VIFLHYLSANLLLWDNRQKMKTDKNRINIMSSCDENYAKLVPVQLLSIADNLLSSKQGKYTEVHYYLFYSRISEKIIESLRAYCETLGIAFHNIYITDTDLYAELASKGGLWTYEAFFSLECYRYLPEEVDRILYIDAADVLILGDIGEYYFLDFDNRSFIVTGARYKPPGVIFEKDDLSDEELRSGILRGLFNSGSYVINVDKMRKANMPLSDYIVFKKALEEIYPDDNRIYFGDQGLLSAVFVGDIKYFGYPKIKNLWYQPYNFCMWFFDRSAEICGGNPPYIPRIIHFAGPPGNIKPWKLTSENETVLRPGQWPYYMIYKLYANQAKLDISNASHAIP